MDLFAPRIYIPYSALYAAYISPEVDQNRTHNYGAECHECGSYPGVID